MTDVQPGDVLLTRHPRNRWGWLERIGLGIGDQPAVWDHVIVAHHTDPAGTHWGVQGQPGVVSYVDIGPWLADRWTIHNADQPKSGDQRGAVCAVMETMVTGKTPYDWTAIVIDAVQAIAPLWKERGRWGNKVPAHVVCSSAADYAYTTVGLANPQADRWCTPADWASFLIRRGWEQ
jgi:hypothetical protein